MRILVLSLVVLALSTTIGLSDRATFDDTKTQIALPLPEPPTIDGFIDVAEWERASTWSITVDPNLEDGIRAGANGDGLINPPVDNTDLSFQVYLGVDANNLYVAVRVTDDIIQIDSAEADSANGNTWEDDSVEVFIDGDNSNFESRDPSGTNPEVVGTGGQFVITAANAYRDAEAGSPGYGETAAWFAKTIVSDTGTGYEAEFRISLSALGNPKPGEIIGFSVAVNDDDDGGPGERQVIWVGLPHTEITYGNVILEGRSYSAPKTTAPTIDGVINTTEYPGASEIKINTFNGHYDVRAGDDTWEVTDHGFSAWAIHDAEAIYVAVSVTDDTITTDTSDPEVEDGSTWEDDSIEVLFDADHSHDIGRGTGEFEGQFVFTAHGARRDNEANNPTFGAGADANWFAATSMTATGYQVEFKVKKNALFNPADGAILGFLIAVNDDDGAGRKAQLGWSGLPHSEFTYGHLTLAGPGGTGSLSIYDFAIVGDNIQLAIVTSNSSGTHVVQRAPGVAGGPWSDVAGVTFSRTKVTVVATFPKPSTSEFYRVVLN